MIKSLSVLPADKPAKDMPPIILWLATLREIKQPELFLKLARQIPGANFQMIGGGALEDGARHFKRIKEMASRIPNLEFVGFVPYHQIDQYFARASILVNTSRFEGFSNTFLQAWARYTPVVSLNSNPDDIIGEKKLGFHSETFEQMAKDVKLLLGDEKLRAEMGMNGRRYVEKEHNSKEVVKQYMKLFEGLND